MLPTAKRHQEKSGLIMSDTIKGHWYLNYQVINYVIIEELF